MSSDDSRPHHICIAYHHPCPDGAFGALAAHLYFVKAAQLAHDAKLSFLPQRVELAPSAVDASVTELYMIDWIGSVENVRRWAASARRVTLLDHHKTSIDALAAESLPDNVDNRCQLEHSGATLAWNHFVALLGDAVDAAAVRERVFTPALHQLFLNVEDRDLWRNAVPDSKAVSTAIALLNFNFDAAANAQLFDELLALNIDSLREIGTRELHTINATVKHELSKSFALLIGAGSTLPFAAPTCLAVLTEEKQLRSEIGNALAQKSADAGLAPMGAVAYVESALGNDSVLKVSLRSLGELDTTPISLHFHGGGHKNASSFNIAKSHFSRWRKAAAHS